DEHRGLAEHERGGGLAGQPRIVPRPRGSELRAEHEVTRQYYVDREIQIAFGDDLHGDLAEADGIVVAEDREIDVVEVLEFGDRVGRNGSGHGHSSIETGSTTVVAAVSRRSRRTAAVAYSSTATASTVVAAPVHSGA